MAPKSARASSAMPAPVGMATSPIHKACARRADATGCLSQTAVHEVLAELGFANVAGGVAGGKRIAIR